MAKYILTKKRDRAALMADPSLDACKLFWLRDRLRRKKQQMKRKNNKRREGN